LDFTLYSVIVLYDLTMSDSVLLGLPSPGIHKFPRIHDYNQNLTVHLAGRPKKDPEKNKTISPLRRIVSSIKGKRKDKEPAPPLLEEFRPYLDDSYITSKITDTDLCSLVVLPQSTDKDEWLATHTISFFEHINLMYGTISEYCTSATCASMCGPQNTQYHWVDDRGKKCKCPAPQYVDYVMSYTEKTVTDETIFPTKYGQFYPSTFEMIARKIHRYLFHVLAHIYHSHFKEILCLKLHPHLNTVFQHYCTFNRQFQLVDSKETDILQDLFHKLEHGVTPVDTAGSQQDADTTVTGDKECDVTTGLCDITAGLLDTSDASMTTLTGLEDNKENEGIAGLMRGDETHVCGDCSLPPLPSILPS